MILSSLFSNLPHSSVLLNNASFNVTFVSDNQPLWHNRLDGRDCVPGRGQVHCTVQSARGGRVGGDDKSISISVIYDHHTSESLGAVVISGTISNFN